MSYQMPGMLDGDDPVARRTARTEVLAQAFADVAKSFFERRKEHEDEIEEAEETQDRMKSIGAGGAVVGVLLLVVGVAMGGDLTLPLAGGGLLLAAGSVGFAYTRYTDAEERIEVTQQQLREDEPDGEVTFVSQMNVPFYLIPYQERFMVFDGLNQAPQTRLELANLDGAALATEGDRLSEVKSVYDDHFSGETVVSPEHAAEFAPNVAEHQQLERPVLDQIDEMTDIASNIERESIGVNVHANNAKSQSMQTLAEQNNFMQGDGLPTMPTKRSRAENEAVVDEIRGVEEQAVSGDLLTQARAQRERVNEVATELAERLQGNGAVVTDHYDAHADAVENAVYKHVCTECLDERVEDIGSRLNLVSEILSSQTGNLGAALSDADLNKGYDGNFTARIRSDVQQKIPDLDEDLKRAFNTLPDLGADGGHCAVHGSVETRQAPESGPVFGETWESLYYAFRDPIMESADDLEREAEEVRQNKEQKMIDLTQYEQIKDRVERQYTEVRTDYEAAQTIEQQLR